VSQKEMQISEEKRRCKMGDWQVKCLKCGQVVVVQDILEQPTGCPNCGNTAFEVVRTPEGSEINPREPPAIAL